jgi:hypothetical protein
MGDRWLPHCHLHLFLLPSVWPPFLHLNISAKLDVSSPSQTILGSWILRSRCTTSRDSGWCLEEAGHLPSHSPQSEPGSHQRTASGWGLNTGVEAGWCVGKPMKLGSTSLLALSLNPCSGLCALGRGDLVFWKGGCAGRSGQVS